MKRMNSLVCTAAIMLISGTSRFRRLRAIRAGRALFAYPMRGQTSEQENADRAACHDWAVAQTGHDPTLVYAAQQTGCQQRAHRQQLRGEYRHQSAAGSWAEPWETPRDPAV